MFEHMTSYNPVQAVATRLASYTTEVSGTRVLKQNIYKNVVAQGHTKHTRKASVFVLSRPKHRKQSALVT